MSSQVAVFLGRFISIGPTPFIFIADQLCDESQRAFLLELSQRVHTKNEPATPKTPNHIEREHGDVVQVHGIGIACDQGVVVVDGFTVTLNHMRSHAKVLVSGYARQSAKVPLQEGFFAVKIDNEGLMQGWSPARGPSKLNATPRSHRLPESAIA
jgi:hypothetical protein